MPKEIYRAQRLAKVAADGGKTCTVCGHFRRPTEFRPRAASADGLNSQCVECDRRRQSAEKAKRADAARARYRRNPAKFRERAKAWRAQNLDRAIEIGRSANTKRLAERWAEQLAYSARAAVKTAKYGPSDIDAAYVRELFARQRGLCHWLGIPMVPSSTRRDPRRPSLDRLDNARGYVRGNVVLACQFANMGRSQCEAGAFAEFVKELRERIASTA